MSLLKRLFKRKLYSFEPDYVVRPSQSILEAMEFAGVSTISIWAKTQMQWATIAKLLADEGGANAQHCGEAAGKD